MAQQGRRDIHCFTRTLPLVTDSVRRAPQLVFESVRRSLAGVVDMMVWFSVWSIWLMTGKERAAGASSHLIAPISSSPHGIRHITTHLTLQLDQFIQSCMAALLPYCLTNLPFLCDCTCTCKVSKALIFNSRCYNSSSLQMLEHILSEMGIHLSRC
jgi:hypothetical protein